MDLVILPQHWISIVCIGVMVGALVFARYKKWMITYALIIGNFIVFIISMFYRSEVIGQLSVDFEQSKIIIESAGLGFRPLYLTPEYFPQTYTLFTSMFVHSGFLHIFGNMIIFFFIGIALEERIGWKKFLVIYLISGICGSLAHSILNLDFPNNYITLVGASGAIFGIMGALAFAYPRDEIVMPIPLGIIAVIRRIKVIYAVIIFAAMETVFVWLSIEDNTAHFAHFGGLIGGFVLAAILIRKKRTHTKKGETLYYDSFAAQRPGKIDFSQLHNLATTPELKEMLDKIENESVPQVQQIWLEHFLDKTICPKCGQPLNHFDDKIWCEKCGFKTKY
jgi:membrane associated rhomboid family serine protease